MLAIRKARNVYGRSLLMRNAEETDSQFILSLRLDRGKARYLSSTSGDLNRQVEWMRRYAVTEGEAYFVIATLSGEDIGTVRLYDARDSSFCWGSWIIRNGAPQYAAVESALMVYAFAMDHLGFLASHFDVRKANTRVWQFHERFGARRVDESDLDLFFEIDQLTVMDSIRRYKKYLPDGVRVDWG
jgi:RimJ/RimL family protein N-acetyltransferase